VITETTTRTPCRVQSSPPSARALREAIAPYLAIKQLHRLSAERADLRQALTCRTPPPEVLALLDLLEALLTPDSRMQIKSPADIAALLMLQMSHLDQEQLRTVLLDTKNRVQSIETIYVGSLNASMVRVGEVFKAAVRFNSAALIVVHNHPSGQADPSPEDVLVTREIVDAGKLLDVDVLDHLVIGAGKYVSMRERGLGFSSQGFFRITKAQRAQSETYLCFVSCVPLW